MLFSLRYANPVDTNPYLPQGAFRVFRRRAEQVCMLVSPPSPGLYRIAHSLILSDCFEKLHIRISGFASRGTWPDLTSTNLLMPTVDIEQNGTVWKSPVLPHSAYDNENDSGIPRRRAPKRLRRSDANGSRSRAHPTAEPWPSSHCKTAQAGIAICGQSRAQGEKAFDSEETTHRAKGGDESPQGGVNPRLRSQA